MAVNLCKSFICSANILIFFLLICLYKTLAAAKIAKITAAATGRILWFVFSNRLDANVLSASFPETSDAEKLSGFRITFHLLVCRI